jgi:parallel beta-helix repeat protein
MKKFLISLMFLAAGGGASAATYHVSDCGTGAATTCVPGNDANTGLSPASPWKSCAKVVAQFSKLAAGDRVLFARGSAQNACKLFYLSNLNSRKANPIVLGAYTPTWGANAGNPIINGPADTYTLALRNSGNATHDEGYVIQDLKFVGPGVTSKLAAIAISNDVDYVTLQRIEITNFRGGVQCDGGTGNPLAAGSDGLTEHIVIRDSNFHHIRGMAILLSCNDTLIENNTFDNNGVGMLDHHIYLHDAALNNVALTTSQVVIRGNKLTNNSPYASHLSESPTPGGCGATAIIVHGLKHGIIIENNLVSEPIVPKNGSCWGISVDPGNYSGIYAKEGFTNVSIRGNTVINYNMGIGVDMCRNCTVENNYVYTERSGATGIVAPAKYFQAPIIGNSTNTNLTVRNNTVYLKTPTYASVGVRVSRDGGNHTVASNLIYFGPGSTATTACFNTAGLSVGAFATFDNNLCHFAGTQGMWDTVRPTLALQQAAGLDLKSLTVNPSLNIPAAPHFALTVSSGSAAVNAGHPTVSSRFGAGGVKRDTSPDIGAFEAGAMSIVPSAPTRIGLQ